MINDYRTLARITLSAEQSNWLTPFFLHIDELAQKYRRDLWSQEVVCDYFWLSFISDLSREYRESGWTELELLAAREWMRSTMHEAFLKVGQYVDEHPLQAWQLALWEDCALSSHVKPMGKRLAAKRL